MSRHGCGVGGGGMVVLSRWYFCRGSTCSDSVCAGKVEMVII